MKYGMGQSLRRREDQRFLTGTGRYVDDLSAPGMVHMVVARAPLAHATLESLNVSAAAAAPGVLAVLTHKDIEAMGVGTLPCVTPVTSQDGSAMPMPEYPLLATDKVRFAGQPIAVVIAETVAQAKDAADLIEADYDAQDCVVDTEGALAPGAVEVWPDLAPGNLAFDWQMGNKADTNAAFETAEEIVEIKIVNNRLVPNAMEPRGALATYHAHDGSYVIECNNQGAHTVRDTFAPMLGIPTNKLRVVTPDVGGGFGMKAVPYAEQALVLVAAKAVGKPVKWRQDRGEAFLTDAHGRDHVTTARMAINADGHFTGLQVRTIAALGAYLSAAGPIICTLLYAKALPGVYQIPAVDVEVKGVFTHTCQTDAYRGAGRPEAAYLLERLVDECARALGEDPAEIRRRNMIKPDQMPYTTPLDVTYDSGDFPRLLDLAMEKADRSGFDARRTSSESRGKRRGFGFAYYIELTGWTAGDTTRVKVDPDGTVTLIVGSVTNGQGHHTAYSQLAASAFGCDPESVRVIEGDTDVIAEMSSGFGGSHFLQVAGPSFDGAAGKVIAKAKKIAANLLEAADVDVEFENGSFKVAGTDKSVSFADVAGAAHDLGKLPEGVEPGLDERYYYKHEGFTFPNGCHVCEVEVDPDTGHVAIERYTVVDDFGRVMNPMLVAGQVHGGVVQGLGQAWLEHTVYDETGQLLTGSYMDYALPRAEDMPNVDFSYEEIPCQQNMLGVKGCGEAGSIGAPPAFMNALLDALKSDGVTHVDMPATPEAVWRAIQDARMPAAAD